MSYTPEWKGPIEGYVVNYIAKNGWKVAAMMDREDAKQEAYLVFVKCRERYQVEDAPHFMALFKTSWHNRFLDMAEKDMDHRACMVPDVPASSGGDFEERGHAEGRAGDLENEGLLRIMVREAPEEIRMVLSLFLNAPQELLEHALGDWRPQGNRSCRDGGSGRLNKLLGLPEGRDTMQAVRDYFLS